MRVGPSTEYPIEWVYQREGLPVKVVRLLDGWRFVEDSEGTQGWIASSQLSPSLGVLIVGDGNVILRADAAPNSAVRWRAEPGVVGDLMWCRDDYCEIDVGGRTGWILKERIWGAGDMVPAS
ncbi:SH3 domain-containing protein [Erythrobacter sp. Alg231-14]|uniref:SH3 domain-containing protein n=1 Tax=Erythrobacter sp. Alg231-14 TaxID=1922225 RepID=UPI00307BC556